MTNTCKTAIKRVIENQITPVASTEILKYVGTIATSPDGFKYRIFKLFNHLFYESQLPSNSRVFSLSTWRNQKSISKNARYQPYPVTTFQGPSKPFCKRILRYFDAIKGQMESPIDDAFVNNSINIVNNS
ncbi:hypothetical protein L9F63_015649, partial [Diploptera punctata]